jgi:TRAP-type transport system periplasmic protein
MKKALLVTLAALMVIAILSTVCACSKSTTTSTAAAPGSTTTKTTAPAAPAKAVVLRLAVPSPKGDSVVNNLENFANDFNAKAGGKYVIEIHPGESLVKFPDSLDAVRTGAVEMDLWPVDFFSSVNPDFAAASLPFVINGIEADAAYGMAMMPTYGSIMTSKFNCKPIYFHTLTGMDLISKKEVKTKADWKNLLVHSISPQMGNIIQYMGGAPVSMPFSDAYQGIQKGVVEASVISSSQMVTYKMYEVAKYLDTCYLTPSAAVIAINMDVWNKMPKDMQDLMLDCGKTASKATNDYYIKATKEFEKILADNGMTVYAVPAAERQIWADTVKPYCDELYSKMDPEFAAKVKEISAQLNAQYPYGK